MDIKKMTNRELTDYLVQQMSASERAEYLAAHPDGERPSIIKAKLKNHIMDSMTPEEKEEYLSSGPAEREAMLMRKRGKQPRPSKKKESTHETILGATVTAAKKKAKAKQDLDVVDDPESVKRLAGEAKEELEEYLSRIDEHMSRDNDSYSPTSKTEAKEKIIDHHKRKIEPLIKAIHKQLTPSSPRSAREKKPNERGVEVSLRKVGRGPQEKSRPGI